MSGALAAEIARGLGGEAVVLAERDDALVVRCGGIVAKAHAEPRTEAGAAALDARLRVAASPRLAGILLAPRPQSAPWRVRGRRVTLWEYGEPLSPEDPEGAPWAEAGALLARLHSVALDALPGPVPPMRGPAKVARALERLAGAGEGPGSAEVAEAAAGLPAWMRDQAPPPRRDALVHGDFHLGQLVRPPGGGWRLIDVDDLGLGDPAWDLARPAAWYATGLLAPAPWDRFLTAYRAAGGAAVPPDGDPWAALDLPARALTVQSAALAVVRARREERPLDEVDEALVEACRRISGLAGSAPVL